MRAAEATTVIFVVTLRQDAGNNISGENFQGLREKLRKMGSHGERVYIIIIIVFLHKIYDLWIQMSLTELMTSIYDEQIAICAHVHACIAFKLVQKKNHACSARHGNVELENNQLEIRRKDLVGQ